ncbi:UDP-diphosphatase [Candidatus Bathyarchaeota archaeon]|nr:MAG: UDP-diphosphatase [Candidatus Bathyarchaeota archaeon]
MSPLIAALIVGMLQGLLEWLPISSQGNLVLLMVALLGLEPADALGLSVYLHLGTGLAALVYFRADFARILRMESESSRRLFRFLISATAATGVVGLPLFLFARVASFYGEALLGLTGVALISTGVIERSARRRGARTAEALSTREGLLLGVVQGLSALPGVSRSGVTTSALLLRGFSGEAAFRVSFLMSVPAVFAAAAGLMMMEGAPALGLSFLAAVVASFLAAFASIDLLLRVARRVQFWRLCVALGLVALLVLIPYLA